VRDRSALDRRIYARAVQSGARELESKFGEEKRDWNVHKPLCTRVSDREHSSIDSEMRPGPSAASRLKEV
jgi:hypothetical protein